MKRSMIKQMYTNKNVLEASKERISFLFDNFKNICVSISGGKDSTVLAHLVLKEAVKRNRKVGLFFLDEEVVYSSTIKQIKYLMNLFPQNTINYWLQIEFNLTNATSITEGQLKCWEKNKSHLWMRTKEKYSIQNKPWDIKTETIRDKNKGFGFYDVIENFQKLKNDTIFLVGLRATESPNRWGAVVKNPVNVNGTLVYWGTKLKYENFSFYPIYDWNFHDVWKYIYNEKLKYSKIYDYQYKKGTGLREIRVSSLIHEKSFKALVDLPEFEPKTYDKLLKRIAGISIGNLYGKDSKMLRCTKLPKNYNSWKEYRDFLLKTYPNENKKWIFEKRFQKHFENEYVARQQCKQLILNDYENNLPVDNKKDPRLEKLKKWRTIL
ncbi:phosphoadenosine phosphosulfate reductase domain-containing protein [Fusobacterium sp. THCT1E2]